MLSTLKSNKFYINCLQPGYFVIIAKVSGTSSHLVAFEGKENDHNQSPPTIPISAHATLGIKSNLLLVTCRLLVEAPDGSSTEARAMLGSSSSASFVSERLARNLHLPHASQGTTISGVASLTHSRSS